MFYPEFALSIYVPFQASMAFDSVKKQHKQMDPTRQIDLLRQGIALVNHCILV